MPKKAKFNFRASRIEEGAWQIVATLSGHDDRVIKGLSSQEDCHDWLNGHRKIDWLRSQGFAKQLTLVHPFRTAPLVWRPR
jgi:hypothetical protein